MSDELIPGDVSQFLIDNINSIAELEGLLLLCNNRETDWTASAVAERLYIVEEQAGEVLARLSSLGFLSTNKRKPVTYRFQPDSAHKAELADGLAEVYSKYLIAVTNLIHSKPDEQVRQFADAFDLRKKET